MYIPRHPLFYTFSVLFLSLCSVFMGIWDDFVLDDAFITYRYADNWVQHGDLSWNVGMPPVEGYTSFLWVLVNAGGLLLGMEPISASRSVSVLSLLLVLYWIWRETRGMANYWRAIAAGAIALSAPLALHATQGMETATASALIFAQLVSLDRFLRFDDCRACLWFFFFGLLAALARPESVLLSGAAFMSALVLLTTECRRAQIRRMVLVAIPFVTLGVAYYIARVTHFGALLPNTFYIKQIWNVSSVALVWDFIATVLGAYLIIAICALRWRQSGREYLYSIPGAIGVMTLTLYFTTITHIQGFMFRFPVVVYPAAIFLLVRLLGSLKCDDSVSPGPRLHRSVISVSLLFFLLWPLTTFPEAIREIRKRQQDDRVVAGLGLRHLDGRMLVSESGALPYHSGWAALDVLGLNDPTIAREGLSARRIIDFAPDLIMLRADPYLDYSGKVQPSAWRHIESRFAAFSAIAKHGIGRRAKGSWPEQVHVYFVNPESQMCSKIVERVGGLRGVEHVRLTPSRASDLGVRLLSEFGGCAAKPAATTQVSGSADDNARPSDETRENPSALTRLPTDVAGRVGAGLASGPDHGRAGYVMEISLASVDRTKRLP